jgi:cytochrome c5
MSYRKHMVTVLVIALLGFSSLVQAKGNWKKGRIYYRMVCTECHVEQAGGVISPSEKTKAEWADYFEKNIHGPQDAAAKYAASYFVSHEYRESIKDTNRAAKKMLKIPDEQLIEDVKAFLDHTAKDSDQPSRCE